MHISISHCLRWWLWLYRDDDMLKIEILHSHTAGRMMIYEGALSTK